MSVVGRPSGDGELLDAARRGDEGAYGKLVEPHRRELHAHCYRMLGSVSDAEDALQESLLRAWRGLPGFEGRSSLRSWLYRIATNTLPEVDRATSEAAASGRLRPGRRPRRASRRAARRVGLGRAVPRRGAGRRARRSGGPLRAARGRRAGVHRGASAAAGAPAGRADPVRCARLLRGRGRRRARDDDGVGVQRAPARAQGRGRAAARADAAGDAAGARRCRAPGRRRAPTSTHGSAATSTRSSRCSPRTR